MGKILITGTGRCGTTFLIQLFSRAGLDTQMYEKPDGKWYSRFHQHVVDMDPDSGKVHKVVRSEEPGEYLVYSPEIRAGLETHICLADTKADVARLPRWIKNPRLAVTAGELIDAGILELDHVFLPVRNLDDVADSKKSLHQHKNESWYEKERERLKTLSAAQLGQAVADLTCRGVPITLLEFPRIVRDPDYLFEKTFPVARYRWDTFADAFWKTANPDYITVGEASRGRRPPPAPDELAQPSP